MAKIICGFPGIGKSTVVKNDSTVIDLDSAAYSKIKTFPLNYLTAILQAEADGYEYILISTHNSVRNMLKNMGMKYTNVYPEIDLGEEYIDRYRERGSPESFINFLEENWDDFIFELQYDESDYIELEPGQFLSDVIKNI
ncbi:hypothetical protein GAP32_429 [Cronobacter phage vB_CsaM_GAP32]|uniref:Uncharacterized protein n=1 Tax=Cronobacter phage vB_CsaM_GAP32 TaxID=1141136 RepID=K4F7R6_9CAUD|nr:hypothetical protein GAP32_429 [Cronobacter phage vB_CsaM_GAP32]AFC21882.1 hypothetical protein GAP32_429 [Cronobacter phage vB_CsaM_GAP32]